MNLLEYITSDYFLDFIGPLAILPLIVFLLLKEFVRTANKPWTRTGMIVLNFFIWPLLVTFGLIAAGRLITLMRPFI
jgi:hypothetical protein